METGIELERLGDVPASVVAEALSLLDQGRIADARRALARALDAAGVPAAEPALPASEFEALAEAELEGALEEASSDADSMIDADGIAFEAIRAARLDEPELAQRAARGGEGLAADSPFHTRTMADLLERQGDAEAAHAIRAALGRAAAPDPDSRGKPDVRSEAIRALERWLARLRGGDA